MRSIVIRMMLVLAALAAGSNALAADTGGGDVFLDARFGALIGNNGFTGDIGSSGDSTTAWGADGGYLWRLDDARSLGFEVGYTHFGQVFNDNDANAFVIGNTTATALTAGGRFQFFFGDDEAWYVQVHGGLMQLELKADFSSSIPGQAAFSGSDSSTHGGPYFGLGIGHHLTQSLSLMLAYDYYYSSADGQSGYPGLNLNMIGLEAEYRF